MRGAELIIMHREKRFVGRHSRVTRRRELAGALEIKKKLHDNDPNGTLNGDKLLLAQRVTVAQPGGVI